MPDEVEGQEPAKAPAPAFDAEALGKQISDAVRGQVKQALDEHQPAPYQPPVQHQPTDALEEVMAPYINKQTGRATLIAMLAADKADFYAVEDVEVLAERLHFKEEIEKRSLNYANGGRPMTRQDIFNHLKGEEEAKVQEFRSKRRKAREDRVAQEAEDHGGGAIPRDGQVKLVTADHAYELQGAGKLDSALEDKAF